MKRTKLLQHLGAHDCELLREGSRHSIWRNTRTGALTTVPRHSEVKEIMVRKICKDLEVNAP
ncbi:MAG: type II toxin-antitoxin system HicA family toxin [Thiohalocapsa sp. PB-PSB1]|nr:MAG: type II toxin-antitoxin system HicA family toxin [Thiohalocapsa sp. PB-PSB1]